MSHQRSPVTLPLGAVAVAVDVAVAGFAAAAADDDRYTCSPC